MLILNQRAQIRVEGWQYFALSSQLLQRNLKEMEVQLLWAQFAGPKQKKSF